MQVIAGSARRLKLVTVPGTDTRPTTDRYKETLFNILMPYVQGSRFLDLYAGSGAIGIEALSRGAGEAVFVDSARKAVKCIQENLEHTHLKDKARVYETDAVAAVRRLHAQGAAFDIIFIDPPYDADLEARTLAALYESCLVTTDTLVIVEARLEKDFAFAEACGFTVTRVKEYKNNKHVFLKKTGSEDERTEN